MSCLVRGNVRLVLAFRAEEPRRDADRHDDDDADYETPAMGLSVMIQHFMRKSMRAAYPFAIIGFVQMYVQ
jgi:hypothetical protein